MAAPWPVWENDPGMPLEKKKFIEMLFPFDMFLGNVPAPSLQTFTGNSGNWGAQVPWNKH